jgi:hypothetical protein
MTGTICCEFIRRTSEERSTSLVSFPIQAGPILSGGVTTEMIIPIRLAEKRIYRDCGLFLTVMTGTCRLAPRENIFASPKRIRRDRNPSLGFMAHGPETKLHCSRKRRFRRHALAFRQRS